MTMSTNTATTSTGIHSIIVPPSFQKRVYVLAKWPGLQGFHRDFHGPDEELRAFDARDRDDGDFGDVRAGLAPRRPEHAVDADGAGGAQVVDRLGDEGLAAR